MKGVRFDRAMRPYGAGDTALLPDDVARRVVDEGAAQYYRFPGAPHAEQAAATADGRHGPKVPVKKGKSK